jgi:hypothetical protein
LPNPANGVPFSATDKKYFEAVIPDKVVLPARVVMPEEDLLDMKFLRVSYAPLFRFYVFVSLHSHTHTHTHTQGTFASAIRFKEHHFKTGIEPSPKMCRKNIPQSVGSVLDLRNQALL